MAGGMDGIAAVLEAESEILKALNEHVKRAASSDSDELRRATEARTAYLERVRELNERLAQFLA